MRSPRIVVPDVPLHITQRGVDRCPTFLAVEDFAYYCWALHEASVAAGCAVHAYVLMTNHVHLLVTPADTTAAARMMRSLGLRYVRYFNDRYRRTGTLWEGRFRSALVDTPAYLFACSRYIEMNPVRAGIATDPAAYEWSSFRHNAGGERNPAITPHPQFQALGNDHASQTAAYRALFSMDLAPSALARLRAAPRGWSRLHATSYEQAIDALRGSVTTTPGDDRHEEPWRRPQSRVLSEGSAVASMVR